MSGDTGPRFTRRGYVTAASAAALTALAGCSSGGDEGTADDPDDVAEVASATPLDTETTTAPDTATATATESGPAGYDSFITGEVGSAVETALETVAGYVEYFDEDSGSVAFTQANQRLIEGDAAFVHQGDWAAGAYRPADGFAFETDWNQVPFPGTDGSYLFQTDSFPYPRATPSPRATTQFLRYCGSVDGQVRFNVEKGAIPPRTDAPTDEFGPFLRRQMREYADATAHPPSVTHGLSVPPETLADLSEATATFTSDWDVKRTAEAIRAAF